MDIKQDTVRANGGKESIWREKYLESLDLQEKESAQQQETINTLRRGLLSVSLVGDGIDRELDASLASLRRQLHKLDQQAELNSLLQTIEEKLLELDNRKIQKADGMLTLLDIAALSLGRLRFAQSHKRAIRRFTRKLKKPGDDPQAQLVLLEEFIQLCVTIFSHLLEADSSQPTGFWQKLFGTKTPAPKASPNGPKVQSLDLNESPREELSPAATPADTPSIKSPVNNTPDISISSPNDVIAKKSTTTTLAADSQLSSSDTESMVKEFIYELLDRIDSADAIKAVAAQLRVNLLNSRGDELKHCLSQIHNLLNLSSANERNTLRKYLEELSESVSQLSQFIGQSKGYSTSLQQLDKRMDKDLRLRLSSIHTNIEKVTDLTDMKVTIKNQLDDMVVVMDEAKLQKRKTESDYLAQMDSLT